MNSYNLRDIKGLLLDFDGTLVDFNKSQNNAFELIMKDNNIFGEKIKILKNKFLEFDKEMWNLFEKRKISIKEVQKIRFQKLIDFSSDLTADAWKINQQYLKYLINETEFFEGVQNSLEQLRDAGIKSVIISNGVDWTQKERIKKLNLYPLINGLLTSEGVGYSKPHPAMFEEGLKILEIPKSNVWVVGDNPIADIQGAKNLGISSCLILNGSKKYQVKPDLISKSFTEFVSMILEKKRKND